ncbi:MAG TPA: hypothetical protein P5114_10985 [Hyphomicrobiaceae bacterium]|nr:hypothetical protein [Hyphomicrobiaceae bacterium]
MRFSKSFGALAGGVLCAVVVGMTAAPLPAVAGKCVRAGGEGSNVLPDVAKFMADAALKNSIAAHGLKPAGKISQTCKTDAVLTTCVSRQRACK